MEPKPRRESHILDVVKYIEKILTFSAIWPSRNRTLSSKLKYLFTALLDVSLQGFLISEVVKNLMYGEYKQLTNVLSYWMSFLSWVIKRTIFAFKFHTFMRILERLEDPMLHDFPQVCGEYVSKANKLSMRLMNTFHAVVSNMVVISLIKPFIGDGLSIPFSLFELGPWFYAFHAYQFLCMATTIYDNTTMDCVAMSLMACSSTQFHILKEKLINARKWAGLTTEEIDAGRVNDFADMDDEFDEVVNKYLGSCNEHHLMILDLVDDIESVFSYLLLSQFSTSVLAICNTFFQFMFEDSLAKTIFLSCYAIALMIQLVLYCYYGHELMLKSEEVRDACYFSEWYKSNKKVRKSIMLIMERAMRPSVITAGKFATVDLVSFTGILKSSYSYFALMSRLYSES